MKTQKRDWSLEKSLHKGDEDPKLGAELETVSS